jgi:hypothetical protein
MNRISCVFSLLLLAAGCHTIHAFAPRAPWNPISTLSKIVIFSSSNEPPTNFYNDFEGFDNNDDDEGYIDTNQLGDWRAFRKSLGGETQVKSVSKENEDVLRTQSKALADEYMNEVWAHATATPELGGFLARMPLEVEIYRNHKHNIMGKKLRRQFSKDGGEATIFWYRKAKQLVEDEMQKIAETAQDGQLDSSELDEESSEMLSLYLDNQVRLWLRVTCALERGALCHNIYMYSYMCLLLNYVLIFSPNGTGYVARNLSHHLSRRISWNRHLSCLESSHGFSVDRKPCSTCPSRRPWSTFPSEQHASIASIYQGFWK